MTTIAHTVLDSASFHLGGDCHCRELHVSQGMNLGYSQCRRCGFLLASKGPFVGPHDQFQSLRRFRRQGGIRDNREDAIRYLRKWLIRSERLRLREAGLPANEKLSVLDHLSNRIGSRAVIALRSAGYRGGGSGRAIEDNIGSLIREAVAR